MAKKFVPYIDKQFRKIGEEFFGKEPMDRITDDQVTEARVFAFNVLSELTRDFGKQEPGTLEELFCNYLFGAYI